MDFRLTPAEARFQGEVHDWLVGNLPAGWGTPGSADCPRFSGSSGPGGCPPDAPSPLTKPHVPRSEGSHTDRRTLALLGLFRSLAGYIGIDSRTIPDVAVGL